MVDWQRDKGCSSRGTRYRLCTVPRRTVTVIPYCDGGGAMADNDLINDALGDQREGKGKDLKGRVKDAIGGLTGDESLQGEGKLDRLKGKIQDTFGKAEEDVDRNLRRPGR